MTPQADGAIKGRYERYMQDREPFLTRARTAATLTIPTLIPPEGANKNTKYPTPFQGLGARGVNNLASKLLLALFPPNSPFFRLTLDDFELEALTKQQGAKAEVEKVLAKIERAVQHNIETRAIRVQAFESLKHLIVGGNTLLYLQPGGGVRVFRLDRYVVNRDPDGSVLEMITLEKTSPLALKDEVCAVCGIDKSSDNGDPEAVEIYTQVVLNVNADRWDVRQEINGKLVPGSEGFYPMGKSPWIPLRMISVDGESYGRGIIEEYQGDLMSLEGLTKAIVIGSAAAAKVIFLVNPSGTTNKKHLAEAASGKFIAGNAADVTTLQLEKFADFRVALETADKLTTRLSYAFLLNSSVQRSGERVTAEEIRYMAGELEDAMGGIYSILSQELQLPLVKRIMHQMEGDGKLPPLPEGAVEPTITTGLEALGRGHDLNKLDMLLKHLAPLGPEVIQMYIRLDDYIVRVATSLGISMDGLIKTKDEIKQEQEQQQMSALLERVGPQLTQMMGQQAQPGA